ncbi:MAG: hypothetical protein RL341_1832 [Pseudomonadota bacterium]|jgi:hypothetical protein
MMICFKKGGYCSVTELLIPAERRCGDICSSADPAEHNQ